MEFKTTLTIVMIIDYVGCWLCEQGFKYLFSDAKPKDIAVRRKDQIEFEEKRKAGEKAEEERKKEIEEEKKFAEVEAKQSARR
jgi:cation-transporting ATPase 13A1